MCLPAAGVDAGTFPPHRQAAEDAVGGGGSQPRHPRRRQPVVTYFAVAAPASVRLDAPGSPPYAAVTLWKQRRRTLQRPVVAAVLPSAPVDGGEGA